MDQVATASAAEPADTTRQFVAVTTGDRAYVIDIYSVREIRGWTQVTPIPDSPPAILGIVNLRGAIVPIVDVHACFGDPPANIDKSNVVVIVSIHDTLVGLLVDSVSDIITVGPEAAHDMPMLDRTSETSIIPELINDEEKLLGVIDLERLIDGETLANAVSRSHTAAGAANDDGAAIDDTGADAGENSALTTAQADLVQQSFARVAPNAEQVAEIFYGRLFETDPSLRRLFKGDMKEQGKKLMAALGVVVSNLKQPEKVIGTIQDMGKRHGGYGVEDQHYDTVGAALLWTLEQGLGEDFTADVRDAWTVAYGLVADTMKAAA